MSWRKTISILMIACMIFGVEGCRKGPTPTKKNTKKIKKGKPIPCPIKDC